VTLNADNIVHQNSNGTSTSSTSTAIVVALAGADTTAADSVVFVGLFGEGLTFATPAGWAAVGTPANGLSIYRRGPVEGLAAGESSWNFTPSATAGKAVVWGVLELTGIDTATTVDVVSAITLTTSGSSFGPASGQDSTYDGLLVEFLCHRDSANATPVTIGSYTATRDIVNVISSTELLDQGQAGTGNSVAMAVSVATAQTIGSYGISGQPSRTPMSATAPGVGIVFIINAVGAKHSIDLFAIDGAEEGSTTGITLGASPYRPASSLSAGVTISGAAARSGSFGWAHDSTSAVCQRVLDPVGVSITGTRPTYRRCFNLRGDTTARRLWGVTMQTSLGGTVAPAFALDATGKISLTSGGITALSDQTVPTTGWFAIEFRHDCSGHVGGVSSTYLIDWAVDYDASLTDTIPAVPQTQHSRTSTISGSMSSFTETIGWTTALTGSMYTDDGGAAPGHNYPIGDLRVIPLLPDPAGTPTCTTTTNFGVMTANGTVAAWNAANFRNAVDEVPPNLGGTRDAAIALLASTTDHAKIPMATYDLAANKVAVRGVKFGPVPIWAASATASTIRLLVNDGTTQHTIYAEADPGADNAATPVWIQGIVKTGTTPVLWNQAAVDSLEIWIGSNDGNPDIGIDIALLQIAVVKAQSETLFGQTPDLNVEAARDPVTQALVGMTVNTPAGQSATVDYEIDGTPGSTGSIAGGSSQYVPLSADGAIETVNKIQLTPG
jgi:hypothetical protein